MDSIFNEIFTHVLESEVAELVSLSEFIYFNQADNPVSNTPEFMKLMLTLESVVKTSSHLVRSSNIIEKRAAEGLEQEREEMFGSDGSDSDSCVSEVSSALLDDGEDFVCDIGPDPNLKLADLKASTCSGGSSMTQSVFFKDEWGQTINERINAVFFDYFFDSSTTSIIASEIDKTFKLVDKEKRGSYVLYYSPLDCPYNVYYGTTCGSRFSFVKKGEYRYQDCLNLENALLPGNTVDCAGYVIYGCSTILTLGIRNGGVHQFTLDPNLGMFIMTATNMHCPLKGRIYTIDESSAMAWDKVVFEYIDRRKKNDIWTNVAVSMQEKGYPVNPHQCSEKWRNLKKTYIKIRDTIGKTSSRRNKWEFYTKMEEALGEQINNLSASPIDNSNTSEEMIDNNSRDQAVEMASSRTMNFPLAMCKLEVYSNEDSSPPPPSPSAHSPALPEESSGQKIIESIGILGNSPKRKSPPLEWYDKYLEELRAARLDRNKRHQDKQVFRQQLLDLCKQILIASSNSSKEMSS